MLTKLTIEKIFEPKTFGEFTSQSIFTKEYPNMYIGGDAKISKDWKVGDIVEVVISEKEKNGKVYKNFSLPKKVDIVDDKMGKIEKAVMSLQEEVKNLKRDFDDLIIQTTGKVNLDSTLERSNKNVREVAKSLGMDYDPTDPSQIPF